MALQQFHLPFIIITVLIQSIRSDRDRFCYDTAQCASLTNYSSDYGMYCYGDQSCAHSYISGIYWIDAYGAYSLFNSIIDTLYGSYSKSYYWLSGYHAGLGAKIICRHNHTCVVDCFANACFNLSLQCNGSCEVNTHSADTIAPIYVQQIDIIDPDPFNHGFNLLVDSYVLLFENDEECSKLHRNFTFESEDEARARQLHLSGGIKWDRDIPVCCMATYACKGVHNVIQSEFIDQRTVCNGHYSCGCDEIILNYNGPIFCSGTASCADDSQWSCDTQSRINTTKTIYCGGNVACSSNQLYNAERVICSGSSSCQYANIFTSGLARTHFIYLLGDEAGWGLTIHCLEHDTCYIFCGGDGACERTQLICDGACIVECIADNDCPPTMEPTMNPTMEPTTEPMMEPTIEPTTDEPTTDPTADPSTEPTGDPTADPTNEPSTDPTADPSTDPTVDPTEDPTAFMNSISLQYTAYIVLEQHDIDDKEAIDIEQRIIIAFYNTSVHVLSTDVMRNGFVSFDFIIATHHDLDSEDVSELLEKELKDDLGDVHVSVVKDDDEPPSNTKANDIYDWLYNDVATSILYGVLIITLTCSICCYLQQRRKSKLLDHHIVQLKVAMEAMQNDRDDDAKRGEKERVSSISLVEMNDIPLQKEEEAEASDDQYKDEGNDQENENKNAQHNNQAEKSEEDSDDNNQNKIDFKAISKRDSDYESMYVNNQNSAKDNCEQTETDRDSLYVINTDIKTSGATKTLVTSDTTRSEYVTTRTPDNKVTHDV